jgi:hypothetical protein
MGSQKRQESRQRLNLQDTALVVIANISEERGFIQNFMHPKAINTEVFVAFINYIADKF